MEMHMVHFNSKFENFTEAVASEEPTAIAVLGFFLEVTTAPMKKTGAESAKK